MEAGSLKVNTKRQVTFHRCQCQVEGHWRVAKEVTAWEREENNAKVSSRNELLFAVDLKPPKNNNNNEIKQLSCY